MQMPVRKTGCIGMLASFNFSDAFWTFSHNILQVALHYIRPQPFCVCSTLAYLWLSCVCMLLLVPSHHTGIYRNKIRTLGDLAPRLEPNSEHSMTLRP